MVWLDEGGCGRSDARLIRPPVSLAAWVEHFWIQGPHFRSRHRWRIVPDLSPHIIFAVESHPGGEHRVRCLVVGTRGSFEDIDVSRRELTIGARLRPTALALLTRTEARVFKDRAFRIDEVFGTAGRELRDRMIQGTAQAAAGQLRRFLEEQFKPRTPDLTVEAAIRTVQSASGLAQSMGLSPRAAFDRAMRQWGLSPKRILRIVRLHRALRRSLRPGMRWSDVAYGSGYADQAHMVREFRSLLGDSPRAWLARAAADSFKTTSGLQATLEE